MDTSLAYCVNDLQLLSGDKMFAKAGPSNILQWTGGLSHGILLHLVVSNHRYQILIWLVLTFLDLTKKVDLAGFHAQRSFQDHLHVFDKLYK